MINQKAHTMKKITSFVTLAAALLLASCAQVGTGPSSLSGDRNLTKAVAIDRSDCKLVLGRAVGTDSGFYLLGFIPLVSPSESVAVDKMYENARQRGAQPEGNSRTFANTSIEHSFKYYILFGIPGIRSTGDLYEFIDKAPAADEEETSSKKKGRR
jgi:hypothetical protein